jgi:predicted metal-binding protein
VTGQPATIHICVKCRQGEDLPGLRFLDAARARLTEADRATIAVEPVACLAVCDAPATVALTSPGKWSHVLKGIDGDAELDDLLVVARAYVASEDGRIPKEGRPEMFKRRQVARTPPQPRGA